MVSENGTLLLPPRAEQPSAGLVKFQRVLVNLATARTELKLEQVAGCSLHVEKLNGTLEIAFDDPAGTLIKLREGDQFFTEFSQLWLKNIAQTYPDETKLLIGTERGGFELVGAQGRRPILVYPVTGAGAIALSTVEARRFRLVKVTVAFDAIPTTAEDATLTLNAKDGADYDTVIARTDPSTGTGTGDIVWTGEPNDVFEEGDELDFAYTNTDTNTVGVRITTEPVE